MTLLFQGGVVGGKRAASYLRRLGIPEDKIAGAYDVVDNDYFASETERRRMKITQSEGAPYFLYVGRLAPEKNISTLLQAHAQYLAAGGRWPLVIVGDGPLKQQLHERAKLQVQRGEVIFAGRKTIHELPDFYAFAGCFVLPSLREPWGLVVNEAMASSLPVIVSSRCGCADDLVNDGLNGLTIDPQDPSHLAAALERLSTLPKEERMRMGAKSQAIIRGYSPEQWAREIRRLTSVLRGGNLRPEMGDAV